MSGTPAKPPATGSTTEPGAPESMLCRAFIGRGRELATLKSAWEQAHAGRGEMLTVAGIAGVGKSRLVRELASWSRSRGATVLVGRASATSLDTPLRPMREALLGYARSGGRPEGGELEPFRPALARLVPDWGSSDGADASTVVVGEGVLRLLEAEWSDRGPALLVLEDLHWADRETLAVVEYLADSLGDHHVLVVATLRDGEPGLGSAALASLAARRAARVVRVDALDARDLEAMARSCLGADAIPDALVSALEARSDGIPFLVEELLAAAVSAGALQLDSERWIAQGPFELAVPDSVASSVAIRLAGLPADLAGLLRAAAVLGRQFDWEVAADAAGCPRVAAPALYRHAVRAQLLEVDGLGFRFRHALTRDAVLAELLPAERSRLAAHARAALVAHDPALSGDRCELAARLAADAGDASEATALLVEAARRALAEGSLASAEALAARARASTDRAAHDAIDALLLDIWAQAGQVDEVDAAGAALLRSLGDKGAAPARLADVRLVMARAALAAGRYDDVDAHVSATRELVAGDDARTARAAAVAALAAMGRDDAAHALPLARAALEAGEHAGLPDVRCEALEVIGRAERGRDIAAAEAAFEAAYRIARDASLTVWTIRALHELGTIDMFDTLAADRLEQARREALAAGALSVAATIDLQLAATYNERGEWRLGLEAAVRCESTARRFGLASLPMSLVQQSFAHARAGRYEPMEAAIEQALATGQDALNVEISAWGNGRAVYHLGRGDLAAAKVALDNSFEALVKLPGAAFPFPGLWALLHTVVDDEGDAARARVAALEADTPVSRETLLAATAVASGRAGDRVGATASFAAADAALARYEGQFRRHLVQMLVAPCAAADGWGDPITWLRESLVAFDNSELAGLTEVCRTRLRDLGATVPRRAAGNRAVPSELAALGITAREVTVLTLVAAGASNRSIADELFLSPRTVEKHVERLMMKAATTRAGLVALAHRAGIIDMSRPPRT